MQPALTFLHPRQNEVSFRNHFQHRSHDPRFVIRPEEAVRAAHPQIDFEVGTDPPPQCLLRCEPTPDSAGWHFDLNATDHLWHAALPAIYYPLVMYYLSVKRCRCQGRGVCSILPWPKYRLQMLIFALNKRACRREISTSGPSRSCACRRPFTPSSTVSMKSRLMIWRRLARKKRLGSRRCSSAANARPSKGLAFPHDNRM